MVTHLKIVFVSWLLLLVLMEEAKPAVVAKGKRTLCLERVKILEQNVAEMKEMMKEQGEKINALEGCKACSKIRELNDTINELLKPDCGDPGVPVHGSKTGDNYKAGETVTFACDAGYHLEGSTTLLCLENGNWNNTIPKCHLLCDEPAPLENGSWIGSELWEGKNVTYQCNEGYNLQGPTVRVCNEIGEWTGEEPTCEPEVHLEDSEILKTNASYLKVLGDFLGPVVQNNSQWTRCWCASLDGWNATIFHSQCDDKGPTVTIVRVGQYIFGGYISISWTSSGCGYWYDSAAFLFPLVNKPGWQPLKLDQTGWSSNNEFSVANGCSYFGPTFGGGFDIHIADHASSSNDSYTYLGYTFNPPEDSFLGDPFNNEFLAGSKHFQPDEVEVFYETT